MPEPWRDASGRLIYNFDIEVSDYPRVCADLANVFALTLQSPPIIGPDQLFAIYAQRDRRIGIDWDIWNQCMIVAQTPESESLVDSIAQWLVQNRPDRKL
jgi:hypothetical protein